MSARILYFSSKIKSCDSKDKLEKEKNWKEIPYPNLLAEKFSVVWLCVRKTFCKLKCQQLSFALWKIND